MQVFRSVGDDDAAVFEVGSECCGDAAVSELIEGNFFPAMCLAAVDGELDHPPVEGVERGSECAACCDFGELAAVADQHDLRPDSGGLIDKRSDITGAGHRGFVDDDQGGSGDISLFDQVVADRGRCDLSAVLEFACCSG